MPRIRDIIVAFFILINLVGCATAPYITTQPEIPKLPGIYHRVEKGQTLWRIAKAYTVELEDIVKVNRIPDATKINRGQLIFIPGAKAKLGIETYKSLDSDENFIWPLKGKIINYFGQVINDRLNKGIEIQSKPGAGVYASRSGRVSFCDFLKGYGKTVILEHNDGLSTIYAQNSELLVKVNDIIKQGEEIAKVGSLASRDSPNFHFEVRKINKAHNPLFYLP